MISDIIKAERLCVSYGGRRVLNTVDLTIHPNEILCIIGHNGAGKSTLLKALFGLVPCQSGQIYVDGRPLPKADARSMAAQGIALVPERRGVFLGLTVAEMFRLAMWTTGVPSADRTRRVEWIFSIIPEIRDFYHRRTETLSGGQQQMVSIGRVMLGHPRCILMDEPSTGLAPKLLHDLLHSIRLLQQKQGISILLVEQNVGEALKVSDRVLVMKAGTFIHESDPESLTDSRVLTQLF